MPQSITCHISLRGLRRERITGHPSIQQFFLSHDNPQMLIVAGGDSFGQKSILDSTEVMIRH